MAMNMQPTVVCSESSFALSDSFNSCRSCIDCYINQTDWRKNQIRTALEYLLIGLNRFKLRPRLGVIPPTRPEGHGSPIRRATSSSVRGMKNLKFDE